MLSAFGFIKTKSQDDKTFIDAAFVRREQYHELHKQLDTAKNQIQALEAKLMDKEKSQEELHAKIQLLTTAVVQEKANQEDQKQQFSKEEDTLTTEIAQLKVELIKQEANYQVLRKKISELQDKEQEQLALKDQYRALQAQMDEKEREYELLVKKLSQLELTKQQIEQTLIQEKNEHQETRTALEMEKEAQRTLKVALEESQKNKPEPLPKITNNTSTLFNEKQKEHHSYPMFSSQWESYQGF